MRTLLIYPDLLTTQSMTLKNDYCMSDNCYRQIRMWRFSWSEGIKYEVNKIGEGQKQEVFLFLQNPKQSTLVQMWVYVPEIEMLQWYHGYVLRGDWQEGCGCVLRNDLQLGCRLSWGDRRVVGVSWGVTDRRVCPEVWLTWGQLPWLEVGGCNFWETGQPSH